MWSSPPATHQQLDNDADPGSPRPLHSTTWLPRRILIVDDDEAICDGFGRLLRFAGYDTVVGGSVSTALDLAGDGFDLMLLDLRLGNQSGLDVLRALGGDRLHGPIIVVTGYGDIRSAVTAMKLGAVDYVTKPLSEEALLRVVQDTLRDWMPPDARKQPSGAQEAHTAYGSYPAVRWAAAVVKVLTASEDPKTVAEWGRAIGMARGTVRNLCRMAEVTAKPSLDLARVLRAVSKAQAIGSSRPGTFLNCPDPRTRERLLSQAGILEVPRPLLNDVLTRQRLIVAPEPLAALHRLLG